MDTLTFTAETYDAELQRKRNSFQKEEEKRKMSIQDWIMRMWPKMSDGTGIGQKMHKELLYNDMEVPVEGRIGAL